MNAISITINAHAQASISIHDARGSDAGILISGCESVLKAAADTPALNPGEIYAGKITFEDGTGYHLILLPGDNNNANWQAQMDWAASIGGELPDRVEGALLYARFKKEFEEEWYWTREQPAANESCAWIQGFDYGGQDYDHKDDSYRARAVRRVAI